MQVMDVLLSDNETEDGIRSFDFSLVTDTRLQTVGGMPFLLGQDEVKQRAIFAGCLQRGTVPQLPEIGNYHAEYITEQAPLTDYMARLVDQIQTLSGSLAYRPDIQVDGDKVTVTVSEL